MDSSIILNSAPYFQNSMPYTYKHPYGSYGGHSFPTTNHMMGQVVGPSHNVMEPYGVFKPREYTKMIASSDISNTTTTASTPMVSDSTTTLTHTNSCIDVNQPLGIVDKYVILSELGQDHLYPVYLASSIYNTSNESNYVVLKAIPVTDPQCSFQNENNIFQLKPHRNLLKCIEIIKNAKFFFSNYSEKSNRPNTMDQSYHIFVLEYQPNGDLLEFVKKRRLDERIARYYFGQVLDAVEYLHLNGYSIEISK